jgi:hypothetical protein
MSFETKGYKKRYSELRDAESYLLPEQIAGFHYLIVDYAKAAREITSTHHPYRHYRCLAELVLDGWHRITKPNREPDFDDLISPSEDAFWDDALNEAPDRALDMLPPQLHDALRMLIEDYAEATRQYVKHAWYPSRILAKLLLASWRPSERRIQKWNDDASAAISAL